MSSTNAIALQINNNLLNGRITFTPNCASSNFLNIKHKVSLQIAPETEFPCSVPPNLNDELP